MTQINELSTITTSLDVQYTERHLYNIEISDLSPDPDQPRKHFDDTELNELSNTIKNHGVLQPILFRVDADTNNLIIVSGERRYRATQRAGMDTIPAIFTTGNASEIAMIENMLRVDLTPLEEAEGLKRLKDDKNYKSKELTDVIGKAESTISEILSLNKLPDAIKTEIRGSNLFSRRQLVAVAKGKDEKEMKKLFKTLQKSIVPNDQRKEEKVPKGAGDVVLLLINNLTKKVEALNISELDDDQRETIKDQFEKLTKIVTEKYLYYK